MKVKFLSAFTMLTLVIAVKGIAIHTSATEEAIAPSQQAANIGGRWRVKFNLNGVGERRLEFVSQTNDSGSFLLREPLPNNKVVTTPAVWSQTTNDRINFSGEVELQLNCCREKGTLIFKGRMNSKDSISGKAIFVGTTVDEENFNGFVSTVGSFTATRVLN